MRWMQVALEVIGIIALLISIAIYCETDTTSKKEPQCGSCRKGFNK